MYGVGVQNENKIPIFDILKESPFATPLIKLFAAHVDESGLLEVNPGKYLNALEILPVSTPIALKPVGLALADGTAVGAVSTLHVPIGAKINLVPKSRPTSSTPPTARTRSSPPTPVAMTGR